MGGAFETPSSGVPGAKQLGRWCEHGLESSPGRWAPGNCPPGPSSLLGKGSGRDQTAPWGVGGGSRSRCPLSVGDHDTQRWGPFRLGGGRADARSRVFVVPVGLRGCCTLGLSAPPCPTLTPGHTCSEPVCPYCGDHLIPVTLRVVPVLKMFLNSQESWKYGTNDFPLNQSFT